MFFCDLEGSQADESVGEAIEALRGHAESVRVLGSYPVGPRAGVPGNPT
jgi:prephenate dehydratase